MNLKPLGSLIYRDYPKSVEEIKKVKGSSLYYEKGNKIPAKYNGYGFTWRVGKNGKTYLANSDGEFIMKDSTKLVKIRINGQDLYAQTISKFNRIRVVNYLKSYYSKFGGHKTLKLEYPLLIKTTFLCPKDEIGDLDNHRIFYEKCFLDSIKQKTQVYSKIDDARITKTDLSNPLIDDSVQYVASLQQVWYEDQQRTMVVEFFKIEDYGEQKNNLLKRIFPKRLCNK